MVCERRERKPEHVQDERLGGILHQRAEGVFIISKSCMGEKGVLNLILNRLQYILSDKFLSSETSSEREKYKIEVDSNKWLDSVTATIHCNIQNKSSQTKMFQFIHF